MEISLRIFEIKEHLLNLYYKKGLMSKIFMRADKKRNANTKNLLKMTDYGGIESKSIERFRTRHGRSKNTQTPLFMSLTEVKIS